MILQPMPDRELRGDWDGDDPTDPR